jgi:hypothetical protein
MILENGLGTPKSKMVSDVETCFFKNSKVCLNLLLGNVFSYIVYSVIIAAANVQRYIACFEEF